MTKLPAKITATQALAAAKYYNDARRALDVAARIDDIKKVRDLAVAAQVYAKQAKDNDLIGRATEIRLRAEINAGKKLAEMAAKKARAKGGEKGRRELQPATLADLGISKTQSSRWQQFATMPADQQEAKIAVATKKAVTAIDQTAKRVERDAAKAERRKRIEHGCTVDDLHKLAESGKKFSVIYADPPWAFEVYSGEGKQRSAENYYEAMTLDAIAALPVASLAADDCALFLWGVWPELPGALRIIEAWGFKYKTAGFVWVKQNPSGEGLFTGMGYWTRANSEPCLLATRGDPLRLDAGVRQVIMSPVQEHSRKPTEARSRIERLVGGPYLELFAREPAEGWTSWGNEIERTSLGVSAAA